MTRTFSAVLFASCLGLDSAAAQQTGVWTERVTTARPADCTKARLVFDPARNRCFLAGGVPPGQADPRTEYWEYDGTNWQRIVPANPLNLRTMPTRFAFSPLRNRILALRGQSSSGGTAMELYEWTGANWVFVSAGNPPASRGDAFEIVWDESRNVLVMFGGGPFGSDTWEWDGTTWSQRGAGGPPGRRLHLMAYDVARQRTVVFGGETAFSPTQWLRDTWEWDGSVWRERFGIVLPPSYGFEATMAYDRQRGRTVLFGGWDVASNPSSEVWEYDGNAWARLTTVGFPLPVLGAGMTYDAARQRFVTFGGFHALTIFGTWEMDVRTGVAASFAVHGSGCAGPAGVPSLAPRNGTRPVLGSNFQLRFGNLGGSAFALVFAALGFDDQTWNGTPLPLSLAPFGATGCSLRTAPVATETLANLGGFADWTIAIPAQPSLSGVVFFLQGGVAAPGFNPAGLVVSDSGRGVAGAL